MSLKFTSIPTKILADSITSSATSFRLNNITGWDGEDLTSGDFGSVAYGVFRNATNTQVEFFEFDPTTIASATITIERRGLAFDAADLTTEVAANKLSWNRGDTFVDLGTDTPQMLQWLKEYIDTASIAGAVPATNAVQGIALLSVAAAAPAAPVVVGDNDPRVPTADENNAMAGGGDFGTPSTTNKFVTDDYLDDASRVVRTRLTTSYVPTPAYQQDVTLSDITTLSSLEPAYGSSSDGSVVYLTAQDGSLYRFERDSISGQYFQTHEINPTLAIPANDNGSIIQIGDYIYLFTNDATNIVCSRFLAADLTGEQVMTVPTVACTGNIIAWTDGTNAYVVSATTATTSRLWTLSGTTFSASTTATITSPFADFGASASNIWGSFWDGTNAYWVGADSLTVKIKKLNTITGTSVTITTKTMPQISDTVVYAIGANIDTRMYLGCLYPIYDETAAVATNLRLFPITKP